MKKEPKRPDKKPGKSPTSSGHTPAAGAGKEASKTLKVKTEMRQPEVFDRAAQLFHAGDFQQARAFFEEAARGPNVEMAQAARVHVRMCESRIARATPILTTADDRYHYAVALMNRRELAAAEQQLREALPMLPQGDHLYYALALCRGLQGDIQGAAEHLRRAIELEPRNRGLARNDPDFAEIARKEPLRDLLFRGRSSPA